VLVQRGLHVGDVERALPADLHHPQPCMPSPRKQVGVVLHRSGHDDVVPPELEPEGEQIERFGGVPREERHVGGRIGSDEPHDRLARLLVAGTGVL
jgi:hypothetical protein